MVKGYDGEKLWFNISEDEAENNFMKEHPPKEGEYSRYESASVTQLPDDYSSSSSSVSGELLSSSTSKQNNNDKSQISIDLKERVPLISSNIIYKRTINNSTAETSANNGQLSPSSSSSSNSNAAVLNWDSIIHKSVRTNEYQVVGIVAAITDDSMIVTSARAKDECNIPKDEVQSFNGSEVILNANHDRLSQFKVKVPK